MIRITRHLRQVRPTPCTRTLCTTSSRADTSAATAVTRKQLLYIPRKTKEEMMALHEEDAKRWNSTTLSKRFGAQIENVQSLLKLYALRKHREKQIEACGAEERKRIEDMREKMLESWSELPEFMMRTRHIADASRFVRGENDLEQQEQEEEALEGGDEVEVEEQEEVTNSKWGAFLEKQIESAEPDTSRKCTYAFVEIGKRDENVRRAVWIREGDSGRLRLADDAERALLLNQVRAKDSEAFSSK